MSCNLKGKIEGGKESPFERVEAQLECTDGWGRTWNGMQPCCPFQVSSRPRGVANLPRWRHAFMSNETFAISSWPHGHVLR
jgi:hypothetical protein